MTSPGESTSGRCHECRVTNVVSRDSRVVYRCTRCIDINRNNGGKDLLNDTFLLLIYLTVCGIEKFGGLNAVFVIPNGFCLPEKKNY